MDYETKTVYLCGNSFLYDLGNERSTRVYNSPEEVAENKKCVEECGIVEVEIRFKRFVQEPVDDPQRVRGTGMKGGS